jgi:hypothetical protein
MSCIRKIAGAVVDPCDSPAVGGIIESVTVMNKSDFDLATVTYASGNAYLIEALVKATSKPAYTFSVVPESANATATRAGINTYDHKFSGMINCASNALKKQLMDLDGGRYVIIVERRNPVPEMKFQVYGANAGMILNALTEDHNANNGTISIELASSAESKETAVALSLFKTDLTVTRAIITTLVTP